MTIQIQPAGRGEIVAGITPAPTVHQATKLESIGGYSFVEGCWNFPNSVTKPMIEAAIFTNQTPQP